MKTSVWHISEDIALKRFRDEYPIKPEYYNADELFYSLEKGGYASIFSYGVVCFYNLEDTEAVEFLNVILEYTQHPLILPIHDDFEVHHGADHEYFDYEHIAITGDDADSLRFVMFHLAQTVALDYYMSVADQLLEKTGNYTTELAQQGRLSISGIQLKKFIGSSLNLRNRIALNLYVFDTPDSAWENDYLNNLDRKLKSVFDLKMRTRNLQEQLAIIKENLDLFKDIMQHRTSNTLEWIIILLILVEVLNLFIEKVF